MDDTTRAAPQLPETLGGLQKQSPDGVERQLPVFSATGRIPFASSGPADTGAGAGAVQSESRLKDEMEMDGNDYSGVGRGGNGWEVPETPEK